LASCACAAGGGAGGVVVSEVVAGGVSPIGCVPISEPGDDVPSEPTRQATTTRIVTARIPASVTMMKFDSIRFGRIRCGVDGGTKGSSARAKRDVNSST
jgi:hypothetical protein